MSWAVSSSNRVMSITKAAEATATVKAFTTWLCPMRREANSTSLAPRTEAQMEAMMMPNVVVLMPPPVDSGDAPMNMRTMNKNTVPGARFANETVLKPAVLGVIPWKRATVALSTRLSPASSGEVHSRAKKASIPTTISDPDTRTTILVWSEKIRRPRRDTRSSHTGKPKPPATTSRAMVRLTTVSSRNPSRLSLNRANPALLKALTEWKAPYPRARVAS